MFLLGSFHTTTSFFPPQKWITSCPWRKNNQYAIAEVRLQDTSKYLLAMTKINWFYVIHRKKKRGSKGLITLQISAQLGWGKGDWHFVANTWQIPGQAEMLTILLPTKRYHYTHPCSLFSPGWNSISFVYAFFRFFSLFAQAENPCLVWTRRILSREWIVVQPKSFSNLIFRVFVSEAGLNLPCNQPLRVITDFNDMHKL